jgi:S1-C subfamily serine protease
MLHKRTLIVVLVALLAMSGLGALPAASQTDGKAWLGVSVSDGEEGVTVRLVVPGSPAAEAGLRRGDVIQAVDETAIASAGQLVDVIGTYAPGAEVVLTVAWRGEARQVAVVLGEQPGVMDLVPETGPALRGALNLLGLDLEITDEGLRVEAIDPDSPLADAGFAVGDLITAINGEPIDADLPGMMLRLFRFGDEGLVFTVQRGGEEIEIAVDAAMVFDDWREVIPIPMPMPMMPAAPPSQLGVRFQTIDADLAAEQDLPVSEGALIVEVYEDTPAAQAGLQVDDIILAVDGDVVDEERTLRDRLYAYEEGDVVMLSVLRAGEELALEVTLGPRGAQVLGEIAVPGHPFEGWPEMWGQMPHFGEGQPGCGCAGGRQMERFLEQHPFMERFFKGQQNGERGGGNRFDWLPPEIIEPAPAAPESSA